MSRNCLSGMAHAFTRFFEPGVEKMEFFSTPGSKNLVVIPLE
jgi:hypothetical protein